MNGTGINHEIKLNGKAVDSIMLLFDEEGKVFEVVITYAK